MLWHAVTMFIAVYVRQPTPLAATLQRKPKCIHASILGFAIVLPMANLVGSGGTSSSATGFVHHEKRRVTFRTLKTSRITHASVESTSYNLCSLEMEILVGELCVTHHPSHSTKSKRPQTLQVRVQLNAKQNKTMQVLFHQTYHGTRCLHCRQNDRTIIFPSDDGGKLHSSENAQMDSCSVTSNQRGNTFTLDAIHSAASAWEEEIPLNWELEVTRSDLLTFRNFLEESMTVNVVEEKASFVR